MFGLDCHIVPYIVLASMAVCFKTKQMHRLIWVFADRLSCTCKAYKYQNTSNIVTCHLMIQSDVVNTSLTISFMNINAKLRPL